MVSIIIPVFNGEKYIDRCIEKLLNLEDFKENQIIFINDCSTDKTAEILESYKGLGIKVISNKQNFGPSYSRNRGLECAVGKYVTFLDVDDFYEKDRILYLSKYMDKNNCVICSDCNLNVNATGKVRSLYPSFVNPFFLKKKLNLTKFVSIDCGPLKPMIRLDFLRINNIFYNEKIKYSEDFDFYFRIVKLCGHFCLLNRHSNIRLIHNDSLSHNREELYINSLINTLSYIQYEETCNVALHKRAQQLERLLFNFKTKRKNTIMYKDIFKLLTLLSYKVGFIS